MAKLLGRGEVANGERKCRSVSPFRGKNKVEPLLGGAAMFKLPAYDPVGIATLGFGILVAVALALMI